ncbi:MAG: hypothetical protein Q7K40_02625 [bacterium]|nr:hypothetical protein [bacterium]
MSNLTKQNFKGKIFSIGIVALIFMGVIGLFAFADWKLKFHPPATSPVGQTALMQLQADMQGVTPHFIKTGDDNRRTYTPVEQKIKDDLVTFLLAANPGGDKDYYSGLWLDAIGKRHILVSQPSSGSSINEIIDSQTGKVTPISAEREYYLASEGRNAALYLGTQAIYIYTLDQDGVVLVSGSQLSDNETYHSGTSDFQMAPVQTHTKNSITISVFDSSQTVQNPDAQSNAMKTMNKKVRQLTLPLP